MPAAFEREESQEGGSTDRELVKHVDSCQTAWVQIFPLTFTSIFAWGKLLYLSEFQFSHF